MKSAAAPAPVGSDDGHDATVNRSTRLRPDNRLVLRLTGGGRMPDATAVLRSEDEIAKEQRIAKRRSDAMRRAVGAYFGQLRIDKRVSYPALVLPGLGSILTVYLPPLVVAKVLVTFAGHDTVADLDVRHFLPYIGLFAL